MEGGRLRYHVQSRLGTRGSREGGKVGHDNATERERRRRDDKTKARRARRRDSMKENTRGEKKIDCANFKVPLFLFCLYKFYVPPLVIVFLASSFFF